MLIFCSAYNNNVIVIIDLCRGAKIFARKFEFKFKFKIINFWTINKIIIIFIFI